MTRPPADQLLERLLVMVPWIIQQDGPLVEEVCERFEISERELNEDLSLLYVCGLYPFTPDTLIEAEVYDGRVFIRFADAFEKPPTFSAEEAVSLFVAASAALALPGNETNEVLRRGLAKLSAALGFDDEESVQVQLESASAEIIDTLRDCVANSRRVQLRYYSFGRDEFRERTIEPYQLFNSEGQWYTQARDIDANDLRTFRVDRMSHLKALDETFARPNEVPAARVYAPRPDDPEVTLELDSSARWVASQYPVESLLELGDGKVRAVLKVSEPVWLERILLRCARHAKVVDGEIDVVAMAARLLARYER